MQHRVAVRTDRTKVINRVNFVSRLDRRERPKVMDMHVPFAERAIVQFKVELAD
jgi:hypothetical protein